jgi:hypothetical protein
LGGRVILGGLGGESLRREQIVLGEARSMPVAERAAGLVERARLLEVDRRAVPLTNASPSSRQASATLAAHAFS